MQFFIVQFNTFSHFMSKVELQVVLQTDFVQLVPKHGVLEQIFEQELQVDVIFVLFVVVFTVVLEIAKHVAEQSHLVQLVLLQFFIEQFNYF